MRHLTGEEITALADTIDTAAQDERNYILGLGGVTDYSDHEWPEIAEIKATRWQLIANALTRLGQSYTAETCEQLAKDIRATLPTPNLLSPEENMLLAEASKGPTEPLPICRFCEEKRPLVRTKSGFRHHHTGTSGYHPCMSQQFNLGSILTKEEAVEVFYALGERRGEALVGIDGETYAKFTYTREQVSEMVKAVIAKRGTAVTGGDRRWRNELRKIANKLADTIGE